MIQQTTGVPASGTPCPVCVGTWEALRQAQVRLENRPGEKQLLAAYQRAEEEYLAHRLRLHTEQSRGHTL